MYGFAILFSPDFRKTMAFAEPYHALAAPLATIKFAEQTVSTENASATTTPTMMEGERPEGALATALSFPPVSGALGVLSIWVLGAGITRAPIAALREWLVLFVDYMVTKRGMSEALNSLVNGTSELYSTSADQLTRAMVKLIDRAVASGDIRLDIDPLDLLRALAGVTNVNPGPDGTRAAKPMVDILIAGIQNRT
jgi:hypothetical protein